MNTMPFGFTREIISHSDFIKHYGFVLGGLLIHDFNEVMNDTFREYDGDKHPEKLEYIRSENGLYWVRWNDGKGNDYKYRWNSPNGHSGMMTAEALSLCCFSAAANLLAWKNIEFRKVCSDIYLESLGVIHKHPEGGEIWWCNA